jgi:hypothetical protein
MTYWERPDQSGDNRPDCGAANRFVDYWVVFLKRTYGEDSYRDQIWDEIKKTTMLLVNEN